MISDDELFPLFCSQCKAAISRAQADKEQGLCPTCRAGLPPPVINPATSKGASPLGVTLLVSCFALACVGAFLSLKTADSKNVPEPSKRPSTTAKKPPVNRRHVVEPQQPFSREMMEDQQASATTGNPGGTATSTGSMEENPLSAFTFTQGRFGGHIRGTYTNTTGKKLGLLMISFGLYDGSGNKVGTAWDSISNLEPGETWSYDCFVFEDRAKRCRLDSLKGL